jgi:hypothetical protein
VGVVDVLLQVERRVRLVRAATASHLITGRTILQ